MRHHDGRSVPGCREKWPDRQIGHRSRRLERRKHCAGRLWLPGHPAACYRPRRSRVHLGNVGLDHARCIAPVLRPWSVLLLETGTFPGRF